MATKKVGKWGVLIFFGTALFLFAWNRLYWSKTTLDINGTEVRVLVAKSVYQQYKGLGKRDSIEPYGGMIFPFLLYGRHGIVMRDMRFPIDIIWIKDGIVVDIAPQVPLEPGVPDPELRIYRPRTDANTVLELMSGKAEQLGIAIGSEIIQKN